MISCVISRRTCTVAGPLHQQYYGTRFVRSFFSSFPLPSSQNDTSEGTTAAASGTPTRSFPLQVKHTSGREKKRLQRRLKLKQQRRRLRQHQLQTNKNMTTGELVQEMESSKHDHDENDEVDDRTWRDILFPNPYADIPDPPKPPMHWPRSPRGWYQLFQEAWGQYKGTWEGFTSNMKDDNSSNKKELETLDLQAKSEQVSQNLQRNLETSKQEGENLVKEIQERTGIYSVDDMKQIAREYMTVATAMLAEFMREYRKGRDEEVEKMLHEYFQDETKDNNKQEEEENESKTKKKRRPKRRIPTLLSDTSTTEKN